LSGGLDSSAVVALMAKHSDGPVKTFSVGFGVEKYDELPYAKQVAEEFSTDHHEITVPPSSIRELPKILWHLDEPMADPTAIPTYFLSKFAKKKVTVVLTGEGGDEIFAGYEQYKIMQLAYKYGKKVPRIVRKHVLANAARATPKFLLDRMFKYSSALGKKGIERFSGFISDLDSPARSYLDLVQICTEKEREELYGLNEAYSGDASDLLSARDYSPFGSKIINSRSSEKMLSQMQLFDIATELPEDLLMKVDKMTMAFSVEARAPLLDVPLAELAFTIPSNMKMKGSKEKYILRKAMAPLLPKSIAGRKKARFFVPIDYWFGGDLKSISETLLLDEEQKLFSKEKIAKIISGYPYSKAYCARQLWSLISLQLWLKQNELGKPVELGKLL
ncbi:MAG: asparagine synthase C-terminal domain-containing protein, partial [Candidatus Micrarchaeota archaeon]